jgi:dihydrofolate reductase
VIALIAAVGRDRVIGSEGRLPWSIPEDLRRFRALTLGTPVIMGRRTFSSIGRPLDGRTNIVLTRRPDLTAAGIVVARSIEEALTTARGDPGDPINVIGGAEVYEQFLPLADRLELTMVAAGPKGDAFFPEWEPAQWDVVGAEAHAGDPAFEFVTLDRIRTPAPV